MRGPMRARVTVQPEPGLMDPAAPRGAIVQITMTDGKVVEHFTKFPPGTKENPLSVEAVSAKTRDLIVPVLGADKADKLIQAINSLETLPDIRALRPFMTV